MFETKKSVIDWFGDRGIAIKPNCLRAWHWADGKLWFIVEGTQSMDFSDTDKGMVDVTETHDGDGNPVLSYELYDTLPVSDTPLQGKTK